MRVLTPCVLAGCIAALLTSALAFQSRSSLRPSRELDVAAISGGKVICVGTAAQFLDENTLLALVGPSPECYKDVNHVELVSFSIDGHVVARKNWPSTFPFVIVAGGRLVLSTSDELLVLNRVLQLVQSVSLSSVPHLSVLLHMGNPPTIAAFPGFARPPRTFQLADDPLKLKEIAPASKDITTLENGEAVAWTDQDLLRSKNGRALSKYDLAWLKSCSSLCQAWTGTQFEGCSNSPSARAVFVAKGSKVPLTDSGGLFPFTRVLVIDLNSGQSVFQKEFFTDQPERAAALNETGSTLAISDKQHLFLYSLPSSSSH